MSIIVMRKIECFFIHKYYKKRTSLHIPAELKHDQKHCREMEACEDCRAVMYLENYHFLKQEARCLFLFY